MKQPVPDVLLKRLNKKPGNWFEVFGKDADEFFHAWSIARYVDQIAAAGKAVYPLPAYMNAALKDPFNPNSKPGEYASGGPTYNVIDIYKAAAPNIDLLAPDLYAPESKSYEKTLDYYARPDNALFVAESGHKDVYARYIFSVLGRGGIGFDPFGIDYTAYTNYPLGARVWDKEAIKPFTRVYSIFGPMAREWAKLAYESEVWGVSEPDDHSAQTIKLGPKWSARVNYRAWQFGFIDSNAKRDDFPDGSEVPSGGVVFAKLGEDEFLVAGLNARVNIDPQQADKDHPAILDSVEEGHFKNGKWVMERRWNGDQIDYGLTFTNQPMILKVKMGTVR
jgi:beta-galactosidase GanA